MTLRASSSYFTSPNYPESSPEDVKCKYIIQLSQNERIELNLEYFFMGRARNAGKLTVGVSPIFLELTLDFEIPINTVKKWLDRLYMPIYVYT